MSATQGDRTVRVQGVDFEIWYGSVQKFGHLGVHQQWANVLGHIADPDGVVSMSYSLNGQSEQPLSIGQAFRRLVTVDDFIIEIDRADLMPGMNEVVLTAIDTIGTVGQETVFIDYAANNAWPENYFVDWTQVTDILDVATVIDGDWTVSSEGLRPRVMGYDRLVGIGDDTWTDYEVETDVGSACNQSSVR